MTGDLTVGSTSRASNTVIRALSGDSNRSGFEAYGSGHKVMVIFMWDNQQPTVVVYLIMVIIVTGICKWWGDCRLALRSTEETAGVQIERYSRFHTVITESVYFNGEMLPSTINTGQGSTEVHLMNQNISTTGHTDRCKYKHRSRSNRGSFDESKQPYN